MIINPLLYRHNLLFLLLGVFVLAGVQFFGVTYYYDQDIAPALTDASLSWALLGAAVFFIANTLSFSHPRRGKIYLILLAPLILAILYFKITVGLALLFIENVPYTGFIEESGVYRFSVSFLIFLSTTLISLMWYRLGERQDMLRRNEEMEKMARDAELFKLRRQLQPHFLFNSLNSINSLIGSRPQEARSMVQQLSDFLRGTIKREDQKLSPLKEELEYLKLYLDIEQVRFGHRLQVKIECTEEIVNWKLPPLILQPLLENAIKFGVYGTTGNIYIQLICDMSDNYLTLKVMNPFDKDMQAPSGTGFGLKSVKRRLFLLYGRTDLLETDITENIFTVSLKIPRTYDQSITD